MTHLSRAELVDYIESSARLSERRLQHAQECAACREQAVALREVLARAGEDPASEPSPLFWDHFAARVSDAVRSEPMDAARWWRAGGPRPFAAWAAAAAAMLIVFGLAWRTTLQAPYFPRVEMGPPATEAGGASPVLQRPETDVEADAAWAVVRIAAEDLKWEDVQAAGIIAPSGAADRLALELTPVERSELARLLDEELKRNGV